MTAYPDRLCEPPVPSPTPYEQRGAVRLVESWRDAWPSEVNDLPDDVAAELRDRIAQALAEARAYGNRESR